MTDLSIPPAAAASPAVPTAPRRLSALLAERAKQEGIHPTAVDGVQLLRATRAVPRAPLVYEPCIVIIGQGSKIGYLGEERYCYDIDHYLVLSVPLPFECETHASPDAPLLGLSIALRPALVQELLLDLDENERGTPALPRGISTAPMCAALEDASCRLLASLASPSESRILGPQLVREIVFRVLQGPYGEALRSLAARHGHFSKMARVLKRMHADYAEALDIETLARDAHMSVSNFHHNFKAVTSNSPLQYLKSIRLHKARMLMAHDGLRASAAALRRCAWAMKACRSSTASSSAPSAPARARTSGCCRSAWACRRAACPTTRPRPEPSALRDRSRAPCRAARGRAGAQAIA